MADEDSKRMPKEQRGLGIEVYENKERRTEGYRELKLRITDTPGKHWISTPEISKRLKGGNGKEFGILSVVTDKGTGRIAVFAPEYQAPLRLRNKEFKARVLLALSEFSQTHFGVRGLHHEADSSKGVRRWLQSMNMKPDITYVARVHDTNIRNWLESSHQKKERRLDRWVIRGIQRLVQRKEKKVIGSHTE
ncbi:hypothetical protein KJ765_05265 [Candidatus Micrarchaeota archaeon]|nr:hypothetical protein [Candidatus Micrarchaeota archaeon]